ncbi:MAG: hypothetical protein RL272_1092 [Candidatus Parcubacteria bacterium]
MLAAIVIACATVVLAAWAASRGRASGREDAATRRPVAASATPFVQRDVVVSGLRLRYIDEGSGPPVVLIPGHTSRIEEYDRLTSLLRGRYRVLVFDFPGTGYSDKPVRAYDVRFYEDVLLGFLDALGVGRCYLAGGSLGGNLALRLAHRVPERFPRIAAWAPGSAWEAMPLLAAFMRACRFGGLPFFWATVRVQSTYWYADDWPGKSRALADTFAYYREVLSPGFVRMYWGMAADQMGRSLFGIAPGIAQPSLLMWGDRDHGLRMGDGVRRIHALMPRAELAVLRGAGHALAAERPEDVAAAVDEFFSRPQQ